jgi:hypothetical protein
MDPLKYGKLLDQTNNKFIIQLTTKNVAVINHYEKENFIRIFKNGDLVLEFRDKFINENSFIRTLKDTKFLFENDKLISTQILNASGSVFIYPLYEDTNSLQLNPLNYYLDEYFYKTNVYKNYKAELFILFELVLVFLVFIIFFVIFPEDSVNVATATFSTQNIIKLRRVASKHSWNEFVLNVNNKVFTKEF